MTHKDKESEQLPQALVDQVNAADQSVSLITSKVDREVLQLARAHFSSRRTARRRRPAWAAIAASVLIAFFAIQLREPPATETKAIYADIDHSGQIDIADVLAVARASGTSKKTQAEIDAFAMRIVSLTPSGDTS